MSMESKYNLIHIGNEVILLEKSILTHMDKQKKNIQTNEKYPMSRIFNIISSIQLYNYYNLYTQHLTIQTDVLKNGNSFMLVTSYLYVLLKTV